MGYRVGVVRYELPPPNDNQRASPARFHSRVTYTDTNEVVGKADIAEAVKVMEVQGEKNSALAKGMLNSGLFMDDASNNTGSGADIMLISLEGHKIHCAWRFRFRALNNEANTRPL